MRTPTSRHIPLAIPALFALSLVTSVEAKDSAAQIQQAAEHFATQQPEGLHPYFKALYVEGEHNAVLNFDYLGLAALESGEYVIAERAFDAAITRIEAIYADNPSAKKARSVFAEEKVKDFKGEPYERAMTYFYRGLLYARAGDYQNARASFLSAEQQSMLSEQESYASTFGLMDYLAGWVSHCEGDDGRASELKARAASLQPDVFGSVPVDASVVTLMDAGTGPAKYGMGKYKERLAFKPSERVPSITGASAAGLALTVPAIGADLNWQATTRGGRPVDAILNGKAQWKNNTETASSALTAVGYGATLQGVSSNNNNLAAAGEIGMAVGLLGGLFANAMTPAADTRAWVSLPAQLVISTSTGDLTPATPIAFKTDGTSLTSAFASHVGRCSLAWGRTQVSSPAQLGAPVLAESKHESANAQMRSILESTFPGAKVAEIAATHL
jgi:tetratricopeptide (TPR) repeat protein